MEGSWPTDLCLDPDLMKRVGSAMARRSSAICAVAMIDFGCGGVNAAGSVEKMIRDALAAVPPPIASTAIVKDWDNRILRQGAGPYVCFPTPPSARPKGREPMCLDEVWLAWLDAWMHAKPFKADRVGTAYMLAGDTGASAIDPYATAATAENKWVVDGPHLMIIVPNSAELEGLSTDPTNNSPYVMWKGTPYVHIMIPVGEPASVK